MTLRSSMSITGKPLRGLRNKNSSAGSVSSADRGAFGSFARLLWSTSLAGRQNNYPLIAIFLLDWVLPRDSSVAEAPVRKGRHNMQRIVIYWSLAAAVGLGGYFFRPLLRSADIIE